MMVLTRYLPRSTGVCADAAFAVTKAASIKIQRICMNALRCAPPRVSASATDYRLAAERPHQNCIVCFCERCPHADKQKGRLEPPFFKLCNGCPDQAAAGSSAGRSC